jgi:hypothetical protein
MRVALVALFLVGCTSSQHYWIPYKPAKGRSDLDAGELYSRTLVAFSDAGLEIAEKDADAGFVVSEWVNTIMDNEFRFRVSVRDGRFEVAALCRSSVGCDPKKRPRNIVETVAALRDAIGDE